ncbi:MAG: hypothetical protein WC560_04650 [Syntrophales bacterium]
MDEGGCINNLKQMSFLYKSSQLVFRHWADDNFDGKVDVVVLENMDTERPWIERWAAVRSSHYDGRLDEAASLCNFKPDSFYAE